MKERDQETEKLKKQWLKKHKVTKCPAVYLTIPEFVMPKRSNQKHLI